MRLKVLDWVVYGMSVVVMLWFLVLMPISEDWRSSSARYFWIAYIASTSFRAILRQYREDRKPLPPLSSPRDLSLLLTDSIKPVYSKDWDNPPLLTDKIKPVYSKDWDNSPSADVP